MIQRALLGQLHAGLVPTSPQHLNHHDLKIKKEN